MTNFLTEKSVTFPNEYGHDQYYSHVEQRTFRSARSTKINISLFKIFCTFISRRHHRCSAKIVRMNWPYENRKSLLAGRVHANDTRLSFKYHSHIRKTLDLLLHLFLLSESDNSSVKQARPLVWECGTKAMSKRLDAPGFPERSDSLRRYSDSPVHTP